MQQPARKYSVGIQAFLKIASSKALFDFRVEEETGRDGEA